MDHSYLTKKTKKSRLEYIYEISCVQICQKLSVDRLLKLRHISIAVTRTVLKIIATRTNLGCE